MYLLVFDNLLIDGNLLLYFALSDFNVWYPNENISGLEILITEYRGLLKLYDSRLLVVQ